MPKGAIRVLFVLLQPKALCLFQRFSPTRNCRDGQLRVVSKSLSLQPNMQISFVRKKCSNRKTATEAKQACIAGYSNLRRQLLPYPSLAILRFFPPRSLSQENSGLGSSSLRSASADSGRGWPEMKRNNGRQGLCAQSEAFLKQHSYKM